MRNKIKMLIAMACLFGISPCALAKDEALPQFMDKLTIRSIKPNYKAGSFGAEPKVVYLSGYKFVRVEEAFDPKMNVRLVIIVNEPDTWFIDLISKTGKHAMDPGPIFEMHSPVFSRESETSKKIEKLEYGREVEFFANLGVQRKRANLDGKQVYKYEHLVDGKLHLTLWTTVDKDIPMQISLREGKDVHMIRYEDYQKNIAFEPELFKLPTGFKISEPKHK